VGTWTPVNEFRKGPRPGGVSLIDGKLGGQKKKKEERDITGDDPKKPERRKTEDSRSERTKSDGQSRGNMRNKKKRKRKKKGRGGGGDLSERRIGGGLWKSKQGTAGGERRSNSQQHRWEGKMKGIRVGSPPARLAPFSMGQKSGITRQL